jgi:hypothetical protein
MFAHPPEGDETPISGVRPMLFLRRYWKDPCLMQDEPERGLEFSREMSLKRRSGCWVLIISMDDSEATSLEQIRAFLDGSG